MDYETELERLQAQALAEGKMVLWQLDHFELVDIPTDTTTDGGQTA